MLEAAGILFFKTAPFSQNRLFVFYVPIIGFFVWVMLFSLLALHAIKMEAQHRGLHTEAVRQLFL